LSRLLSLVLGTVEDGARLALEALKPLRVPGDARRLHLERHIPAEAAVASTVDLAHAARAERREDP